MPNSHEHAAEDSAAFGMTRGREIGSTPSWTTAVADEATERLSMSRAMTLDRCYSPLIHVSQLCPTYHSPKPTQSQATDIA